MNPRASRKPKFMPSPEAVIDAVRARGSDASGLRDAAHEACHGIETGIGRWDRDSIHAAMMRLMPADRFIGEVTARAVEQVVCSSLGVETKNVAHWAYMTCLESTRNGLHLPGVEPVEKAILAAMDSEIVRNRAAEIIALAQPGRGQEVPR